MQETRAKYLVLIPVSITLLSFLAGAIGGLYWGVQREIASDLRIFVVYFFLGSVFVSSILFVFFRFLLGRVQNKIMTSIMERERVEDELRQTELQYRQIFDGVNDAILVETTKGEVLDVNARACEMFGWGREEFLTKTVKDMVPPEYQALLPEEQDGSALSEKPFETINMRANGERFPVAVTGRIQEIGDQKRLLIVVRDITERKKAEEELLTLSRAIAHSPTSVVITDANAKISYVNPAYLEVTGYAEEEVMGKYATFLYSDLHSEEFYMDIWKQVSAGDMWRGEIGSRNRRGEIVWEVVSIAPIVDANGKITNFVGVLEDITENKKFLAEMEKAKDRSTMNNRTLSRLFAAAATRCLG
ncbi:MAG: hypothetical protein B6I38_11175 [Anaerolineaceae bacterium 4572_5.1]|nr:MAG: hypothetical protein B6I38_11175 [Anaerolineaceae bacterium 4572_5.1]